MKFGGRHCRPLWLGLLLLGDLTLTAQGVSVTAQIERVSPSSKKASAEGVVLWLVPISGSVASTSATRVRARLLQKDKQFHPHLLVVPAGTGVDFPNRDPFFHNVFSLFEGKRFDLGLYEAGTSRTVHFDRPGISYIFCNIHPQMSAVVIALKTPYYATADMKGTVVLSGVPPGRYRMEVWAEGASAATLENLSREVTVGDSSASLGKIRVPDLKIGSTHTNKYGREYEPPPSNTPYDHP